jgi:hypothetical protein
MSATTPGAIPAHQRNGHRDPRDLTDWREHTRVGGLAQFAAGMWAYP